MGGKSGAGAKGVGCCVCAERTGGCVGAERAGACVGLDVRGRYVDDNRAYPASSILVMFGLRR